MPNNTIYFLFLWGKKYPFRCPQKRKEAFRIFADLLNELNEPKRIDDDRIIISNYKNHSVSKADLIYAFTRLEKFFTKHLKNDINYFKHNNLQYYNLLLPWKSVRCKDLIDETCYIFLREMTENRYYLEMMYPIDEYEQNMLITE